MLDLSDIFTKITHNHPQALSAVKMYLSILYDLMIGLKNIDDYIVLPKLKDDSALLGALALCFKK